MDKLGPEMDMHFLVEMDEKSLSICSVIDLFSCPFLYVHTTIIISMRRLYVQLGWMYDYLNITNELLLGPLL